MSEIVKQEAFLTKEAIQKKANNFLSDNKDVKEVFITADGFVFLKRNFANDHAVTLEGNEVFDFKNTDNGNGDADDAGEDLSQLTEEQKQLLETGLQKENYNAIKALAKVLKIEIPDQKAETLVKALEDYKANNPIK